MISITQYYSYRQTVSEVRLKFPKFTTNFTISLSSCQSNLEVENEGINFTWKFKVRKLRVSQAHKYKQVAFEFEVHISDQIFYNMDGNVQDKMTDKSYQLWNTRFEPIYE